MTFHGVRAYGMPDLGHDRGRVQRVARDVPDRHQQPAVEHGELVEVAAHLGLRAGRLIVHGQVQARHLGQSRLQQAALEGDRDPVLLVVGALRLHRGGDRLGQLAQHRESGGLGAAPRGHVDGWTIDAAVEWAEDVVRRGAGEILLTSMDRDGTRDGFDLELTAAVSASVDVPVIASGGVGTLDDLRALAAIAGLHGIITGRALYERRFRVAEAIEVLA